MHTIVWVRGLVAERATFLFVHATAQLPVTAIAIVSWRYNGLETTRKERQNYSFALSRLYLLIRKRR